MDRRRGKFGYIETEEQYDALCDFTHKLKAKGAVIGHASAMRNIELGVPL